MYCAHAYACEPHIYTFMEIWKPTFLIHLYKYTHVCTYMYTHTHNVCNDKYMNICTHKYTWEYTLTCVHMYTHIFTALCIWTYIHGTCMCVNSHTCTYTFIHVHAHTWIHNYTTHLCTYTNIPHIYIYTCTPHTFIIWTHTHTHTYSKTSANTYHQALQLAPSDGLSLWACGCLTSLSICFPFCNRRTLTPPCRTSVTRKCSKQCVLRK